MQIGWLGPHGARIEPEHLDLVQVELFICPITCSQLASLKYVSPISPPRSSQDFYAPYPSSPFSSSFLRVWRLLGNLRYGYCCLEMIRILNYRYICIYLYTHIYIESVDVQLQSFKLRKLHPRNIFFLFFFRSPTMNLNGQLKIYFISFIICFIVKQSLQRVDRAVLVRLVRHDMDLDHLLVVLRF